MLFWTTFKITFSALSAIFCLMLAGVILTRRRLFTPEITKGVTQLFVNFCAPAFILHKMLTTSYRFMAWDYALVFLLTVLILLGGAVIGLVFIAADRHMENKKEFLAMSTFQNCGYLPIALVAVLFNSPQAEQIYGYIFILLLIWSPLIWSVGVWLISREEFSLRKLKNIFNPPFLAVVLGTILLMTNKGIFVPKFLLQALKLSGDCTVPLSMIILGATLAEIPLDLQRFGQRISYLVMGKLVILPFLAIVLLQWTHLEAPLATFVVMQAAMPIAVTLPIISIKWGNESNFITQAILINYIISLFTIPLFLTLASLIF